MALRPLLRRSLTAGALAAVVAVPGAATPAGAAPAAVAAATVFGSSVELRPGETMPLALDRVESGYGRLGAVRVFQGVPDPRVLRTLGTRSAVISFDLPPDQVLAGTYDAQFRAFFAAVPSDHPTWWSYFHEADVAWQQGRLTDLTQLRAAWNHLAVLARQAGSAQLRTVAIFVGWSGNPRSGIDLRQFLPDSDLLDVIAFDNYNTRSTDAGTYGDPGATVDLDRTAAAAFGKPFGVAEFASVVVGADTVGRADYVRQFARAATADGAAFTCYYDSDQYGLSPEYRLLDPPARTAMHDVLLGTPVLAPAAPAAATTLVGRGALAVSWQLPDDHGAPVSAWAVTATDTATGRPTGTTVPTGPTSAAVTGLADGHRYAVTVGATNSAGAGPVSAPTLVDVVGGTATAPGAPTLTPPVPAPGALRVSWTPPASDGGSPLLGWVVTALDTTSGQQTAAVRVPGDSTSATVPGLVDGHPYSVSVVALNAFGSGTPATAAPAVPFRAPVAPGPPSVTPGDSSVRVSWTSPTSDGGRAVTGYLLSALNPWGRVVGTTTVPGTVTSGTLSGLANGQPVTVTVTASNGLTGPASARSTAVVPAGLPGAVPAHAFGGSRSDVPVSATAWWTAAAANGSQVTGYRVTVFALGSSVPVRVSGLLPPEVRHLEVDGLVKDASYQFVVVAVNAVGTGAPSAPATAVAR